jgi:hypothetical protein
MLRRDSQPIAVRQRTNRRGLKDRPLFFQVADESIGHFGNRFAAEHADEIVDLRAVGQQVFLLPLGKATRNDHALRFASLLQGQHFIDGAERLGAGPLDESAGVHDDEVGPFRLVHQLVAVDLQQPQHPLAVDQVFRAAQADERIRSLRSVGFGELLWRWFGRSHKRDRQGRQKR